MKFFILTTPPNIALRDQLVAAGHVSTFDTVVREFADDVRGLKEKEAVLASDIVILNEDDDTEPSVILGLALAKQITILKLSTPSSANLCSFWNDPNILSVGSNEAVMAFFASAERAKAEQLSAAVEVVVPYTGSATLGIGADPKEPIATTPKMAFVSPDKIIAAQSLSPEDVLGLPKEIAQDLEEQAPEADAAPAEETETESADDDVIDPGDGDGIDRIRDERLRHVLEKGFDEEHDRQHVNGELAWAAVCYAAPGEVMTEVELDDTRVAWTDPWPWSAHIDRRGHVGRIRRLTIAGALIAAEIDRLIPYARTETAPADSSEGSALVRSVERSDGSGSREVMDQDRGPLPDAVVDMLVRKFGGKHFFQAPAVAEALGTDDPDLVLQVIDAMLDEGHWEAQVGYRDPKRQNGIILARKDGNRLIDAHGNLLEDDDKVLFFRAVR